MGTAQRLMAMATVVLRLAVDRMTLSGEAVTAPAMTGEAVA